MTTDAACRSCGTELRQSAKFCDECGSPTTFSADAAKYKQVTVLFADVVRSMDIAAALDVERLREIMADLVQRSTAVVQRYGGGSVEYTGDGVMAIFGAPVALEDHAFRACLAALAIQEEAKQLATEVQRRDGVALQLRVGLNSGRVIAGALGGSAPLRYAAIGEPVGFAQRMESVAPAGGVMLSESTARLVEHSVAMADPERVHIKGADEPVVARRLTGIRARDDQLLRAEADLVGRHWEMAAIDAMMHGAIGGRGGVVNVIGPAGIGKSRVAREVAAAAAGQGFQVYWAFCESHARDVPFNVLSRLLRAGAGIADLEDDDARDGLRAFLPDADPQDQLLLEDLLGIAKPGVALPSIDPDARRRRLTALINAATLARTTPALYIIEDAHWIDTVSESMLVDLLTVIPRTPSLVLITSRPEYDGGLKRATGGQTISLAPLRDSDTAMLLAGLLGSDTSVGDLSTLITDRAAGNPFFAEEMVRDFVQRGVLTGERGGYICRTDIAELNVPATVQAAIEARIDRLSIPAKQTLYAASVIGARFEQRLIAALGIDALFDELLSAELIDQVRFTPHSEYAFRHPLIRAVAYESQLKSDRSEWHRRLAGVIQDRDPESVEKNASLIAEHLHSAGELHAAYHWHMRAGAWSTNRDVAAARVSWERARQIADALPADDPERLSMRIAPRTMLCGTAWRIHMEIAKATFDELRELCVAAGDKASLAIAMAGLVMDHTYHARIREASRLASEAMALAESIGDPDLTVGLSVPVILAKIESAEWADVLRWSQTVIDLAGDDPSKGNLMVGSPLAVAFATRAIARFTMGRPGWRDDQRRGVMLARSADPVSYAAVISFVYAIGVDFGVLRPDGPAIAEIQEYLEVAERSSDDLAVANARTTLGLALVHRHTAAERDRGKQLLAEMRDVFVRRRHNLAELPIINAYVARETARQGNPDGAIPLIRAAVDELFREGRLLCWTISATAVLVETLLDRNAEGDVAEASVTIERLANAPADDGTAMREIWLLRLRALLARAAGDSDACAQLCGRYRAMAEALGFDGHIAWAEAMAETIT
ncbi:adenylate/guanylate cyclase domain-containing protein [Mycolicibacterium elephantis]|uniref:adenylate/guanylate cyclase domain-containing protein n=1 Tax=Mycolicibacterium elephantis TaxID=81858 RepID=UPI0007E944A9|nr:adenylate/guanylate cyclase domain-containing protein [Mycolicibacterium elephantis]OBB28364.1 cyclase [Mycolicibacterium elephantis]